MDLKRKLARLDIPGLPVAPPPPVRAEPVEAPDPNASHSPSGPNVLTDRNVVRGLPLDVRQTPDGPLHARERRFSPEHRHGRMRISEALRVDPSLVAQLALDDAFEQLDFDRALHLDLETTGLAGGTGTLPIVVGLGAFERDSFVVEQLFLRRPGEERPILQHVAERLAAASCIVSYNGRSFDWPLLRNRFVMNRMAVPTPPPHLDLLHVSRRIFRYRACGGRLADVESEVLGHRRVGDVDGALIPELYFRYLRSWNAAPLLGALDHNVSDVVLLAALLAELARGFEDPTQARDGGDLLGFAQVAFRAGDSHRALLFARAASARSGGQVAADALALEARLSLRAGNFREAASALERAMAHADEAGRPALHLALAKLCEHRLKRLDVALDHARSAAPAEGTVASARRIHRIEQRQASEKSSSGWW